MRWFRRRRSGPSGDLPCQELVELVTDYFDGALSAEDRRRFEQHIAACGGCSAYVDQLRDLKGVLGEIGPEDVSPEAARELGEAFRTWRASRS
jgi:anti-sigma factor RsiW